MNSMVGLPRVQGKTGQVTDACDKTLIGQWTFEVHVSVIGHHEKTVLAFNEFYATEELAAQAMWQKVQEVSKVVCDFMGLPHGKNYLDLKTGHVKPWLAN